MRDPKLLWQPYHAHWFGFKPGDMIDIGWRQYIGMHEFVKKSNES